MPEVSKTDDSVDFSIVIPTYNEARAIREVIKGLREVLDCWSESWEILVVDDGSTDDTVAEAANATRVIESPVNCGYGASLKKGFLAARGDWLVMLDGDGSYPVNQLNEMKLWIPCWDQICGVRQKEAGTWKPLRFLAKWLIRKLAEFVSGTEIPDLNSGFRVVRADVARTFLWAFPQRFSASTTLTLAFLCNGHPIKFVNVDYVSRIGQSSFHPVHDTFRFALTVIRVVLYFNPLRVLLPIAFTVMIAGLLKSVYDSVTFSTGIHDSDVILVASGLLLAVLALLADLIVSVAKRHSP